MSNLKNRIATGSLLLFLATGLPAADPPKDDKEKGSVTPKDITLELKLTAKKDTYVLDLAGKTAKELQDLLTELAAAQAKDPNANLSAKVPTAPAVDLALELRNTGKEDIHFLWGRRAFYYIRATPEERVFSGIIAIEVQGPKGFNLANPKIHPPIRDAEGYGAVTLAPGKSFDGSIKSLNYGRGFGAYWLAPGEYSIRVKMQEAIGDPGKGAFTPITITSNWVKVKVVEKKEP